MRIALLDDYQHVARASADWEALPTGCNLQVFHDRLASEDEVARKLADFDGAPPLGRLIGNCPWRLAGTASGIDRDPQ
jgi:hypothetical protein